MQVTALITNNFSSWDVTFISSNVSSASLTLFYVLMSQTLTHCSAPASVIDGEVGYFFIYHFKDEIALILPLSRTR
jgi:hypothetical protein